MSDEMWEFRAEDFAALYGFNVREAAAHIANARLREWIEAAPVLRCAKWTEQANGADGWVGEEGHYAEGRTHTARLINIQPLVKDTMESLLREFLACGQGSTNWGDVMNRARKLLEGTGLSNKL